MLQSAIRRTPLDAELRLFLCQLLNLPYKSSDLAIHSNYVAATTASVSLPDNPSNAVEDDQLSRRLKQIFLQHGINYERFMSVANSKSSDSMSNLANTLGLPVELLQRLHTHLVTLNAPRRRFISERRWIPTGCSALDRCLGGSGWRIGELVELAGPSAAGKTHLCISTAATLLWQDPQAHVLYISTLGNYNHTKLIGQLAAFSQTTGRQIDSDEMKRMLSRLWMVDNPEHVYHLLILLGKIQSEPDYQLRLVVIDSLASLLMPFTHNRLAETLRTLGGECDDKEEEEEKEERLESDDYGHYSNYPCATAGCLCRGPLADPDLRALAKATTHPSKIISEVGKQLRMIADNFSLTVLVTNFAELTAEPQYQRLDSLSSPPLNIRSLRASLGAQWKQYPDTRLMLKASSQRDDSGKGENSVLVEANVRLLNSKIPSIGGDNNQLPSCTFSMECYQV